MASAAVEGSGAVDFNCAKSNKEIRRAVFFSFNPRKKEVEKLVKLAWKSTLEDSTEITHVQFCLVPLCIFAV